MDYLDIILCTKLIHNLYTIKHNTDHTDNYNILTYNECGTSRISTENTKYFPHNDKTATAGYLQLRGPDRADKEYLIDFKFFA